MALHPSESPGFLLWHATLRWQRAITVALAPFELTHVQFVLLTSVWWLDGQGERPNQLAVAAYAGTDVKMTSQVLRTLESNGLVRRETDPADTRAKLVRVTEHGAELAPQALAAVEQVDADFFRPVPTAEALRLLRPLTGQPEA
ncbi:MarR family winged helix-turn-helix transcriptional regulator [Parafrankia discariae]|uniref:MarR family winged helix-turn-helix transcriptional regulator n=1 Tax=Parafrankia discariae TaxID=365528 RepID=UPI00037B87BC|nr:MarR family winged helix-turn-helix transcriptional regulator [Parafrankia discariae]